MIDLRTITNPLRPNGVLLGRIRQVDRIRSSANFLRPHTRKVPDPNSQGRQRYTRDTNLSGRVHCRNGMTTDLVLVLTVPAEDRRK